MGEHDVGGVGWRGPEREVMKLGGIGGVNHDHTPCGCVGRGRGMS